MAKNDVYFTFSNGTELTMRQYVWFLEAQTKCDTAEEFTPEIEDLGDRIVWFLMKNDIDTEEYLAEFRKH